jgi:hypothetical protein
MHKVAPGAWRAKRLAHDVQGRNAARTRRDLDLVGGAWSVDCPWPLGPRRGSQAYATLDLEAQVEMTGDVTRAFAHALTAGCRSAPNPDTHGLEEGPSAQA